MRADWEVLKVQASFRKLHTFGPQARVLTPGFYRFCCKIQAAQNTLWLMALAEVILQLKMAINQACLSSLYRSENDC